MSLYNVHTIGSSTAYCITKFTDNLEVEASYEVTHGQCTCPSGSRNTCRHRKMLPLFIANDKINSTWFYNYDTHAWVRDQGLDADIEDIALEVMNEPAPAPAPKSEFRRRI